jgi:hypothetical protein
LLKKFGEKIFKLKNFTAVFVKVTIFRNMAKILFLPFSIFSNSDTKSNFSDSFCIHLQCLYLQTHLKKIIFGLNYHILTIFAKILPKK